MSNDKTKIDEAVVNYYKLKNNYEMNFYDNYVKDIVTSNESKKGKKRSFQKLPKPKCINCMRNVGTLFSITVNKNLTNRLYKAQCGDISDPCPLDIQIEMPNIEEYSSILSNYNVDNLKKEIIKAKNDLLFGYIKEDNAFKIFDDLSNKLKEETVAYDYFLEQYIELFDSVEQRKNLQTKQVQLGIVIQEYKNMMLESKKQNDTQLVNNAVEFYINTIIPLLNEIQSMKYPFNKVEMFDGKYHLMQKKNTIEQTFVEYDNGKLISFVTGTKNTKSRSKTVKVLEPSTKNNTKTKTKKNKPLLQLVSQALGLSQAEPETLDNKNNEEKEYNENNEEKEDEEDDNEEKEDEEDEEEKEEKEDEEEKEE